jgi:hypothetical protein
MKVLFWPHWRQVEENAGNLKEFLKKLKIERRYPDLFALAKATIQEAERPEGLEALIETKRALMLRHQIGIWEFRIPPTRRGGVLRIYFCKPRGRPDRIVCLEAEVKKDAESSPTKVESARRKLLELRG